MIQVKNLTFSYNGVDNVLEDLSFSFKKGSFNVILGHNGSGKSTLAKILVGLLPNYTGEVIISNMTLTSETVQDIRKKVGIVFQNPDNQFVGVTVRHDIAFGLENMQIPSLEIEARVLAYASRVGMKDFLNKEPHQLSGGQKQRIAIASAIAMNQDVLILDEATSMLDPQGVKDILALISDIHKNDFKTIIMITHDLRMVQEADYIIALKDGRVIIEGSKETIFNDVETLLETKLLLPIELDLYQDAYKHKSISKEIKESLWAYNFKK
jgi:energy-coupling factor transport system ATP-binding protein